MLSIVDDTLPVCRLSTIIGISIQENTDETTNIRFCIWRSGRLSGTDCGAFRYVSSRTAGPLLCLTGGLQHRRGLPRSQRHPGGTPGPGTDDDRPSTTPCSVETGLDWTMRRDMLSPATPPTGTSSLSSRPPNPARARTVETSREGTRTAAGTSRRRPRSFGC